MFGIAHKLRYTFILLGLIIFFFSVYNVFQFYVRCKKDEINETSNKNHEYFLQLNNILQNSQRQLIHTSLSIAALIKQNGKFKVDSKLSNFIMYLKNTNLPSIRHISVHDYKGNIAYSTEQKVIGQNYSYRDYTKWAISHMEGVYISKVQILGVDGTPGLFIVSPIYFDGKYGGLVNVVVSLTSLFSEVNQYLDKLSTVFVTIGNDAGETIYAFDKTPNDKEKIVNIDKFDLSYDNNKWKISVGSLLNVNYRKELERTLIPVGGTFLLVLLFVVYVLYDKFVMKNIKKQQVETKKYYDLALKNEHLAAIGQSTAMVAHDVRKPLASMKALLSTLPLVKDNPVELEKMTLAVDNSIRHTNTMLNDILEFSRDSTALNLDKHNPQSIIISALSEALRVHPNSDVKISYNLQHKDYLHVDGDRIVRVLVNIIDNALDAMTKESDKAKGNIWVSTCESRFTLHSSRFTIVIANDGPSIPDSALEKLFDPFFTQGKKGGTGLGLSICQKIIEMHGGKIEARSKEAEKQRKTEFIIELPATEGNLEVNEAELINHSNELKVFHEECKKRPDCCDVTTLAEFMRINKERGRISYLLIVDDEPLFRETVRTMLYNLEQVKDHVKVIEADSAEAALELFNVKPGSGLFSAKGGSASGGKNQNPRLPRPQAVSHGGQGDQTPFDYVITDIDLGKMRMNGYEFAQLVMEKYPETYVLIHSNKRKDELDKNIREIKSSHFMGFLPKPMTQSELLQFLACKTFEVEKQKQEARGKEAKKPATKASAGKQEARKTKKVLVVNDDENLSLSMKFTLGSYGARVLTASNVREALMHLASSNVDIILSDINLGENEPSGYDMLKSVREKNKNIPFYFMSGYSHAKEWPKAEKLGANGYFQLPIEIEDLKKIIN